MRVWSGLLVAGLAAVTGCRAVERWAKDRDRPLLGEPASRDKNRERERPGGDDRDPTGLPRNWLDTPGPRGGSLGDPRDPNFDVRNEVKGLLAGVVVDPDGRGVPYLPVTIDLTDPMHNGGAPVTAETDKHGYFLIRGLKPNQAYTLSAQAKQGGRTIAGQAVARTPSPVVRIQLRDDLALPPAAKPGPDLPPAGVTPPTLFDTPTPVPMSKENGSLPYPAENPRADGSYTPVPPAIPAPKSPVPRPDLVAPGPAPDKPPVVNIPGPSGLLPPPPLPPTTSRSAPKGSPGPFSLTDPLGRPRSFPSGRTGELVLLDFMTTTCVPCKRAVPALTALQAKHGAAGLEVVGVACDDAPETARRELASKYADEHRLNYLVYAEPGAAPGKVMKQFGVTVFPTLVLIDGSGAVVWQGRDLDELERVIRR